MGIPAVRRSHCGAAVNAVTRTGTLAGSSVPSPMRIPRGQRLSDVHFVELRNCTTGLTRPLFRVRLPSGSAALFAGSQNIIFQIFRCQRNFSSCKTVFGISMAGNVSRWLFPESMTFRTGHDTTRRMIDTLWKKTPSQRIPEFRLLKIRFRWSRPHLYVRIWSLPHVA